MNPTHKTIDTFHGSLELGRRTLIMGILNVTPDSFSDGGANMDLEAAVGHAFQMSLDGADIIDIGGESTRPGSEPVAADEQMRRVVPAIREIRRRGLGLPISVDTQSAEVAWAALNAGADIVNDVSGARADPGMPGLLAAARAPFVIMHMLGTPRTMQQSPHYDDVVAEIAGFFEERAAALERAGIDTSKMIVDPGIGFGKMKEHNLEILRSLRRFVGRWPLMVGPSRKRFMRDVGADPDTVTAIVALHCALCGVTIVRVHEVKGVSQMVRAVTPAS